MTIVPFPDRRSHVGHVLVDHFLRPEGLTPADLAERADLPIPLVHRLLTGEQRVTPTLAAALARAFDASAAFWLALQMGLDGHPPG